VGPWLALHQGQICSFELIYFNDDPVLFGTKGAGAHGKPIRCRPTSSIATGKDGRYSGSAGYVESGSYALMDPALRPRPSETAYGELVSYLPAQWTNAPSRRRPSPGMLLTCEALSTLDNMVHRFPRGADQAPASWGTCRRSGDPRDAAQSRTNAATWGADQHHRRRRQWR